MDVKRVVSEFVTAFSGGGGGGGGAVWVVFS